MQDGYAGLAADVSRAVRRRADQVGALGVSAMMHGYLAFDADGELLTPFRTWRNTNTGPAVEALSEAFGYNIPHRWSIAHLYQAVLDDEEHVAGVAHLTTLAGYVHWQLTDERVLGVGDASGMFPIDTATRGYDAGMLATFDDLVADRGLTLAGGRPAAHDQDGGRGGRDPDGGGRAPAGPVRGAAGRRPLCPPEGDAGTGMVATNSVAPRTGNVSAGTSIFAMVVLEQPLAGCTTSSTWSPRRPATRWPWCTATTAPAS